MYLFISRVFLRLPTINPSSNYKLRFDVLMLFVILFYLFIIPIHIALEIKFIDLAPFVSIIFPFLLILEILLNLNTGFYDKGQPVKDKK
jgi:hypothetical protein